jgi:hypothetical protein
LALALVGVHCQVAVVDHDVASTHVVPLKTTNWYW